jgi:hypothetical protein
MGWFGDDYELFLQYHHLEEEKPDLRELFFDEKE